MLKKIRVIKQYKQDENLDFVWLYIIIGIYYKQTKSQANGLVGNGNITDYQYSMCFSKRDRGLYPVNSVSGLRYSSRTFSSRTRSVLRYFLLLSQSNVTTTACSPNSSFNLIAPMMLAPEEMPTARPSCRDNF